MGMVREVCRCHTPIGHEFLVTKRVNKRRYSDVLIFKIKRKKRGMDDVKGVGENEGRRGF